jgi:hypothetical protein
MSLPQRLIDSMLEPTCVECGLDLDQDGPDCTEHRALLTERDLHWAICGRCKGEGTLRGWAGAYTESDRAEWSEEDYEDYFETRRTCDDCDGDGKVRAINLEAIRRPGVREYIDDYYDTEAIYAAERRAGA